MNITVKQDRESTNLTVADIERPALVEVLEPYYKRLVAILPVDSKRMFSLDGKHIWTDPYSVPVKIITGSITITQE